MTVEMYNVPSGLKIYPETKWGKVGKIFGFQDIKLGDTLFDETFVVRGKNPIDVKNYLTAGRRMAILNVYKNLKGFQMDEGKLFVIRKGQLEKPSEFEQIFTRMGQLGIPLSSS